MRKVWRELFLIFISFGAGFLLAYSILMSKEINVNQQVNLEQISPRDKVVSEVSLILKDPSGEKKYLFSYQKGMTAFDLLEQITEKEKIDLQYKKDPQWGVFIEKIGEFKNGVDNFYWLYKINQKEPSVAADRYFLNPNDKVEFFYQRFEK